MNHILYATYLAILKKELSVALGCTEPIAIAFAAAKARYVLGMMPEHCTISCSGNIIKNVMGVTVPNSGGLKGVDIAAVLGIVGGNADLGLSVLESVREDDIKKAVMLVKEGFCTCQLIENVENLYIIVTVTAGSQSAEVEIKQSHSNITRIMKNGKILLQTAEEKTITEDDKPDKSLLNVKDILAFANCARIEDVEQILSRQITYNCAISKKGLEQGYGAQVGRVLMNEFDSNSVKLRAKAAAAAGSDARMGGCPLPVVINSGSGNQGITVSLPVIEYAREYNVLEDTLYRALIVSNLVSIHQKKYIGNLSAYCGAVSAACGAGAGIGYLLGCTYEEICDTITNTIANIGGMVCDGAKPSCAAKIASAVEAAIMGLHLSRSKMVFAPGEGLVKDNVEETIACIGRMGREGMRSTDVEILNIMLNR